MIALTITPEDTALRIHNYQLRDEFIEMNPLRCIDFHSVYRRSTEFPGCMAMETGCAAERVFGGKRILAHMQIKIVDICRRHSTHSDTP